MIFERRSITPPEGGEPQEALAIGDCRIRLTPNNIPQGVPVMFTVYARAESSRSISVSIGDASAAYTVGTGWQRIELAAESADDVIITATGDTTAYLYKAQMETGNRASDWKAAPEDVDAEIGGMRADVDEAATAAAELRQNIERCMDLTDSRGFVVRLIDLDTGEPIGDWETIMNEDSYRIYNRRLQTDTFKAKKDRVTLRKLAFDEAEQTIIIKSDGRGGMAWVRG